MHFIDLQTQYQQLQEAIDKRIQNVLTHGQYIMGPEVEELEQCLQEYTGSKYCITTSSGTDALLIALMALDIQPGDEVITTPFSFAATSEVIVQLGAIPVFIDICPKTYNLNADLLASAISAKTKAIMPVSLYGQVADMDQINAFAQCYHLPVIEDGAQSFGAYFQGKKSGHLSTIGCTSFFPSKPLGCYGDGGALFTDDPLLAEKARALRIHGQIRRYHHQYLGISGRMDTLQCAIILAKLPYFDQELAQRAQVASIYQKELQHISMIELPKIKSDRSSAWAQFTIHAPHRNQLRDALQQAGIPTAIHYPQILPEQPAYIKYARTVGALTVARAATQQVLSLPMHPYLSLKEQQQVISAISATCCEIGVTS